MQHEVDLEGSNAYNMQANALHSNRKCKDSVDERDFFHGSI